MIAAAQTGNDVCRLIPDNVIAKTQGSKPVSARATSSDRGNLQASQCFYELAPFAQSVSLQVISRSGKDHVDVREFWKSRFHAAKADDDGDKEDHSKTEEHERQKAPVAVKGVAEEAFWV